jgi:putative transposase
MFLKKTLRVGQKMKLAQALQQDYKVSIQRACKAIRLFRSAWYYRSRRRDDRAVRERIKEIAASRVRYGYDRIHTMLRREEWKDNRKRVHRIYKEEGLNLRSKRPRRNKAAAHRLERPGLDRLYQCCSMDFVADQLFDGRKFRVLTLVDNFSRQTLQQRLDNP